MKFSKYSILAVAAAAVTFTACSDDDYTEGPKSAGAFFPGDSPTTITVALDDTSFSLPIDRTSTDAAATASLTVVDTAGIFNVPSTVSFDADKLASSVVVTYDPEKLHMGVQYAINIKVVDGSVYGLTDYTFVVTKEKNWVVSPTVGADGKAYGYGTYYFACLGNYEYQYESTIKYDADDPAMKYVTIKNWGDTWFYDSESGDESVDLVLYYDSSLHYTSGSYTGQHPAWISYTYTGYNTANYGKTYICDLYHFYLDNVKDEETAAKAKYGYGAYNPETGLFSFTYVIIAVPEYNVEALLGSETAEYFQLAGFPDYGLTVDFYGTLQTGDTGLQALYNISVATDIKSVRYYLTSGEKNVDLESAKEVTDDPDDSVGQVATTSESPVQVSVNVTEPGTYTLVAVGYDSKGAAQIVTNYTSEISFGGPQWRAIGTGMFADGFFGPYYAKDIYEKASWNVPIQQNRSNTSIYRLMNPWKQTGCPWAEGNESETNYNVSIDCSDGYVVMTPQVVSLANTYVGDGTVRVANNEGWVLSSNPGATMEQVITYMKKKKLEQSTFEDGIITIPQPRYADGATNNIFQARTDAAMVIMPSATEAAKKRAIAKAIANPSMPSMLDNASRNSRLELAMPRQFNGVAVKGASVK